MSHFWAKFKIQNDKLYRFDTRIYLRSTDKILDTDQCLGAIVGKNPGSAIPKSSAPGELCEIDLNNDKLLPTVKNIVAKSSTRIEEHTYVQVLNLFYLCNSDLKQGLEDFENSPNAEICYSEQKVFPWVWFLWGGYNKQLSEKKKRFKSIKASKQFFLNNAIHEIEEGFPEDRVCAKHTQGMQHDLVIPFLRHMLQ